MSEFKPTTVPEIARITNIPTEKNDPESVDISSIFEEIMTIKLSIRIAKR